MNNSVVSSSPVTESSTFMPHSDGYSSGFVNRVTMDTEPHRSNRKPDSLKSAKFFIINSDKQLIPIKVLNYYQNEALNLYFTYNTGDNRKNLKYISKDINNRDVIYYIVNIDENIVYLFNDRGNISVIIIFTDDYAKYTIDKNIKEQLDEDYKSMLKIRNKDSEFGGKKKTKKTKRTKRNKSNKRK